MYFFLISVKKIIINDKLKKYDRKYVSVNNKIKISDTNGNINHLYKILNKSLKIIQRLLFVQLFN